MRLISGLDWSIEDFAVMDDEQLVGNLEYSIHDQACLLVFVDR